MRYTIKGILYNMKVPLTITDIVWLGLGGKVEEPPQ